MRYIDIEKYIDIFDVLILETSLLHTTNTILILVFSSVLQGGNVLYETFLVLCVYMLNKKLL